LQVLHDLKQLHDEAPLDENGRKIMDKVIIVSSWLSLLGVVNNHAQKRGYKTCSIVGTMSVEERSATMKVFNQNKMEPQILFLSMDAGGVGLNLTGANHVFFLEPNWNVSKTHFGKVLIAD
jgi:transcription termination factor 2